MGQRHTGNFGNRNFTYRRPQSPNSLRFQVSYHTFLIRLLHADDFTTFRQVQRRHRHPAAAGVPVDQGYEIRRHTQAQRQARFVGCKKLRGGRRGFIYTKLCARNTHQIHTFDTFANSRLFTPLQLFTPPNAKTRLWGGS